MDRLQARLPASLGLRIVDVDKSSKTIWFIPSQLDVSGSVQGTKPQFTARRLPAKGRLVSGRISIVAAVGADEAVARLARAEFGEDAKAKRLPVDSFQFFVLSGDEVVSQRERVTGPPRDIPVQFPLPDAANGRQPDRLEVIIELFVEYQVRSELGEVQEIWQVLLERVREEAKRSGDGLTLQEVELLVEGEIQRRQRPSDGPDGSQTRIDKRRFLMQLLRQHMLELAPRGAGKPRRSGKKDDTVRYQVHNRAETSRLLSAIDLKSVRTVTLPMTVSALVEIHDQQP